VKKPGYGEGLAVEVCGEEGADEGDAVLESIVWCAGGEESEGGGWQLGRRELEGKEDYELEDLRREGWCLLLEWERR